MAATRTIPGPFYRVGITIMRHFDDQMAVETHCRFAVDNVRSSSFAHGSSSEMVKRYHCNFCAAQFKGL